MPTFETNPSSLLKLGGLVAYFIFSIAYAAGSLKHQQHAIGFQYWHNPGAFADGFRGVAKVFVFVPPITLDVSLLLLLQRKPEIQDMQFHSRSVKFSSVLSSSIWARRFSLV